MTSVEDTVDWSAVIAAAVAGTLTIEDVDDVGATKLTEAIKLQAQGLGHITELDFQNCTFKTVGATALASALGVRTPARDQSVLPRLQEDPPSFSISLMHMFHRIVTELFSRIAHQFYTLQDWQRRHHGPSASASGRHLTRCGVSFQVHLLIVT